MSQSDLARATGLTRQAISYYLGEKSKRPDDDALKQIAHVFKLPPETVYRAAGLLPASPDEDEMMSEISHIYHELNHTNRDDLLDYARLRLQKQEKEKAGKRARVS